MMWSVSFICAFAEAQIETTEMTAIGSQPEFIPYAFQICSQLLELHPTNVLPAAYENLLAPLLHASLWESRGNVPALVRLWKALLIRGGPTIAQRGHVQALLGIFQKLVTLKATDVAGVELVGVIYESIPM